jgi:hypothetical protein
VLVVDLDGTLVTVNTFPHFIRFLLRQLVRERRIGAASRVARALVGRKASLRSHRHLKAVVCRTAVSLEEAAIGGWADTLLERFLNVEVDRLVRSWPAVKVLSTAAPEPYALVIGRALGFHAVQGSYEGPGGFVDNSGPQKALRLRHAALLPLDTAVTDDVVLDRPLLELVQRRLLVVDGRLVAS